jgi:hypothetical protein
MEHKTAQKFSAALLFCAGGALQFADAMHDFRGVDPDITGIEYYQVWGMIPDMTDGFARLATAYQNFVQVRVTYLVLFCLHYSNSDGTTEQKFS